MAFNPVTATGSVTLEIDHTKIDATLTNFPIAIKLSSLATGMYAALGVNNLKMAVTSSDGTTQYPVEIECWESGNQVIHTQIPSISSTVDTEVEVFWDSTQDDNSTYVGVTGSTPAKTVWDSDFIAVYHMAQDPSAGGACILDSTSNSNHGTPYGSMLTEDLVNADVGKAISADGTDDYIACGSILNLGDNDLVATLELLSTNDKMRISTERTTSSGLGSAVFWAMESGYLKYLRGDLSSTPYSHTITASSLLAANQNNYFAFVSNGASTARTFWTNTDKYTEVLNFTYTDAGFSNIELFRHRNYTYGTEYTAMTCASARLSSVARSDAWAKATNYSLKDTLLSVHGAQIEILKPKCLFIINSFPLLEGV